MASKSFELSSLVLGILHFEEDDAVVVPALAFIDLGMPGEGAVESVIRRNLDGRLKGEPLCCFLRLAYSSGEGSLCQAIKALSRCAPDASKHEPLMRCLLQHPCAAVRYETILAIARMRLVTLLLQ